MEGWKVTDLLLEDEGEVEAGLRAERGGVVVEDVATRRRGVDGEVPGSLRSGVTRRVCCLREAARFFLSRLNLRW